jgi:hypothetical protein
MGKLENREGIKGTAEASGLSPSICQTKNPTWQEIMATSKGLDVR